MTKTNLDIIVTGMDHLQNALNTVENRINAFDEAYPKQKNKEKRNRILAIILSSILFLVIEVLAISLEDGIWMTISFFGFIFVIVWNTTSKRPLKIEGKAKENENQKKMLDYIVRTKNSINLLLEKKDQLYDFYLSPSQDEQVLMFVAPELNDKGEEVGKFYSIFINELKIVKDGKYSTLIIEPQPEWALGYKTYLEIPYKVFKEAATWLR